MRYLLIVLCVFALPACATPAVLTPKGPGWECGYDKVMQLGRCTRYDNVVPQPSK
jgi:hypothetical protein